jgi:hypothetical protein
VGMGHSFRLPRGKRQEYQKRASLLKKSLLHRSVVPNQVQSTQKPRLSAPEGESEQGTKELLNTLLDSRKLKQLKTYKQDRTK